MVNKLGMRRRSVRSAQLQNDAMNTKRNKMRLVSGARKDFNLQSDECQLEMTIALMRAELWRK